RRSPNFESLMPTVPPVLFVMVMLSPWSTTRSFGPAATSIPCPEVTVSEAATPGAPITVIALPMEKTPYPPELIARISPPGLVTASARVKLRHSLPGVQLLASLPNVATKLRLFCANAPEAIAATTRASAKSVNRALMDGLLLRQTKVRRCHGTGSFGCDRQVYRTRSS